MSNTQTEEKVRRARTAAREKITLKSVNTKLTRELRKKYGIKYKRCAGCKKLVPYIFRFFRGGDV